MAGLMDVMVMAEASAPYMGNIARGSETAVITKPPAGANQRVQETSD